MDGPRTGRDGERRRRAGCGGGPQTGMHADVGTAARSILLHAENARSTPTLCGAGWALAGPAPPLLAPPEVSPRRSSLRLGAKGCLSLVAPLATGRFTALATLLLQCGRRSQRARTTNFAHVRASAGSAGTLCAKAQRCGSCMSAHKNSRAHLRAQYCVPRHKIQFFHVIPTTSILNADFGSQMLIACPSQISPSATQWPLIAPNRCHPFPSPFPLPSLHAAAPAPLHMCSTAFSGQPFTFSPILSHALHPPPSRPSPFALLVSCSPLARRTRFARALLPPRGSALPDDRLGIAATTGSAMPAPPRWPRLFPRSRRCGTSALGGEPVAPCGSGQGVLPSHPAGHFSEAQLAPSATSWTWSHANETRRPSRLTRHARPQAGRSCLGQTRQIPVDSE